MYSAVVKDEQTMVFEILFCDENFSCSFATNESLKLLHFLFLQISFCFNPSLCVTVSTLSNYGKCFQTVTND